jgi:hypothetical protein
MSKRARKAAIERERNKLFPPGFWDQKTDEHEQRAKAIDALLRHAKTLRDLASRGMKKRKFAKEAAKAEVEAKRL